MVLLYTRRSIPTLGMLAIVFSDDSEEELSGDFLTNSIVPKTES